MGRFWLGIGLLTGFLVVGIWMANCLGQTHTQIAQTLEQAAEQTLDGDLAKGQELLQQAQKAWQEHHDLSAAVADHAPMEEIDSLFAQLQVYGKAEQPTWFAAVCAQLSKLVAAVGEAHSLTWWNLL